MMPWNTWIRWSTASMNTWRPWWSQWTELQGGWKTLLRQFEARRGSRGRRHWGCIPSPVLIPWRFFFFFNYQEKKKTGRNKKWVSKLFPVHVGISIVLHLNWGVFQGAWEAAAHAGPRLSCLALLHVTNSTLWLNWQPCWTTGWVFCSADSAALCFRVTIK